MDGWTVQSFVEDERAFNSCVDARFASLDTDRDSRLSYAEMAGELMALRVREAHFGSDAPASDTELAVLYRALFVRFNRDGHGAVDRHEFHAEMREVMLAAAHEFCGSTMRDLSEEGVNLGSAVAMARRYWDGRR